MPNVFYFAWTDPETAFSGAHHVEDEKVVSASFSQNEGDFGSLSVVIKNPKRGLLLGQIWVWFSWNNNITTTPLFYGRLIGVPDSINKELVTLVFQARPTNFKTAKQALADTLKVAPYYDPIWISPDKLLDPDTVLEGYTHLWHINPVTHAITISDYLVGEDGDETFLENEVPYDSVDIKIGSSPKRSIDVTAAGAWGQTASGNIDMGKKTFMTFTGGQLISDWPKPGASLGGGWVCLASYAIDVFDSAHPHVSSFSYSYKNEMKEHEDGDTMSENGSISGPVPKATISDYQMSVGDPNYFGASLKNFKRETVIGDPETGQAGSMSESNSGVAITLWQVDTYLLIGYNAKIGRGETIAFTLKMNVQPIVTLADEDEPLKLDLAAVDVTVPIPPSVISPIVNANRNAYFPTDRGQDSVKSAIMLARHQLIMTARAVDVTFACKFERAIALTLRKNAVLNDPRLPGGISKGKISSYGWSIDGDSGVVIGTVTMGCAIGYNGSVSAVAGTSDYALPGYMTPGYQIVTGAVDPIGTDVGYTFPTTQPAGALHFPLRRSDAVLFEAFHGNLEEQGATFLASADSVSSALGTGTTADQQASTQSQILAILAAKAEAADIWWELWLRPLDQLAFDTPYPIIVTDLEVPKGIDLEAAPL